MRPVVFDTHKFPNIPTLTVFCIFPSMKRIGLNLSASSPQMLLILEFFALGAVL